MAEAHYFVMPRSPLTEANDSDASDSEDIEDEEEDEDQEEEEEGKEGEVVTRAKKWGKVEKDLFKTLIENREQGAEVGRGL
jgi:hypothetical protein